MPLCATLNSIPLNSTQRILSCFDLSCFDLEGISSLGRVGGTHGTQTIFPKPHLDFYSKIGTLKELP